MRQRDFVVGRSRKAADAWRWHCFSNSLPFLQANLTAGELYVELRAPWKLTRRLWWRLEHSLSGSEYLSRSGDSFWLMKIARGRTERRATEILECIRECRPALEERFDIPPEFDSGLAECVWNEGLESVLTEGANYEILEIPNMAGHVVVWREGQTPVVGIHLERFRLHYPDERAWVARTERDLVERVSRLWVNKHQLALKVTACRDPETDGFKIKRLSAALQVDGPEQDEMARLRECLGVQTERGDSVVVRYVNS